MARRQGVGSWVSNSLTVSWLSMTATTTWPWRAASPTPQPRLDRGLLLSDLRGAKRCLDLPGFVRLRVPQNYHSPYGIAPAMRQHLPFDFDPANPLPGLEAVGAWEIRGRRPGKAGGGVVSVGVVISLQRPKRAAGKEQRGLAVPRKAVGNPDPDGDGRLAYK